MNYFPVIEVCCMSRWEHLFVITETHVSCTVYSLCQKKCTNDSYFYPGLLVDGGLILAWVIMQNTPMNKGPGVYSITHQRCHQKIMHQLCISFDKDCNKHDKLISSLNDCPDVLLCRYVLLPSVVLTANLLSLSDPVALM